MPRDYKGSYGSGFGLDDPKKGKRSFDKPFREMVLDADPEWDRERRREVEYTMSNGRVFRADPAKRWPYTEG